MEFKLTVRPYPGFEREAISFQDKYDAVYALGCGAESYSKRKLQGYTNRTCLFCGRSYPNASFSDYSHLLPKMIGNTDLYSDFECDDCNRRFSTFEDDLAAFLGLSRSIIGLQGVQKTKGFVGRKLKAKSRSFMGDNILIIAPEDVERVGGRTTIRYIKNPFIPNLVYKVFLKSALSILDKNVINTQYKSALEYLAGTVSLSQGAWVGGYTLSFSANHPLLVQMFVKKNSQEQIPTYVFTFHFQNRIIVFPLLTYQEDSVLDRQAFTKIMPPPYFYTESNVENLMPTLFMQDLYSKDEVTDEEEVITYQLTEEQMKNAAAYDPSTGKVEPRQYNPSKTKYLIVTKPGMKVDPAELSAFIQQHMEGKS